MTATKPRPLVTDRTIVLDGNVSDDDGELDPELICNVIRKMFPHIASVTCLVVGEEQPMGRYVGKGDYLVKIIENLSLDSPLLHYFVWEEPKDGTVGLTRIDPSTGHALTG